jgi:hypothetical protein
MTVSRGIDICLLQVTSDQLIVENVLYSITLCGRVKGNHTGGSAVSLGLKKDQGKSPPSE